MRFTAEKGVCCYCLGLRKEKGGGVVGVTPETQKGVGVYPLPEQCEGCRAGCTRAVHMLAFFRGVWIFKLILVCGVMLETGTATVLCCDELHRASDVYMHIQVYT